MLQGYNVTKKVKDKLIPKQAYVALRGRKVKTLLRYGGMKLRWDSDK
jgi:hypothetical protein